MTAGVGGLGQQPTAFEIAEWAKDAAKYIGGLPDAVAENIGASVALRYLDALGVVDRG